MNQVSATNRQAIGILLLSVLAGAIGQLTLKAAVDRMGEMSLSFQMLLGLATNPVFILAMGIYFVSAVLWLLSLLKADLSFAYPFLSLTYIAVLFGGAFFFHESISWLRLVGCAVIIIGLLIIARGETNLAAEAKAVE